MRISSVFLVSLFLAACGNNGTVSLQFQILDDVQDINVAFGNNNVLYQTDDVKLAIDKVTLDGDATVELFEDQTAVVMEGGVATVFDVEVPEGNYNKLSITFGLANEATADAAQEAQLLGRSLHTEGVIDDDNNGVADRRMVTYVPIAITVDFDTDLTVVKKGTVNAIIDYDLTTIYSGVDFGTAQDEGGDLFIREDIAQTVGEVDTMATNLPNALTLTVQ